MSSVALPVAAWSELVVTLLCSLPLPAVGDSLTSISACVKVCVAVQVVNAPTLIVVAAHVTADALSSTRLTPVSVTLPVLEIGRASCRDRGDVRVVAVDVF